MLARLELYSEAWRERRWKKPVTSWDDNSRKHGEAMFDAIRGRGRVPSFVEVSFQSSSTELWDWDLEWELTYTTLEGLRAHLPDDCFPLSLHCGGVSFVSDCPEAESELSSVAMALQEAFAGDAALAEPGLEVGACWVDDERTFADVLSIPWHRWLYRPATGGDLPFAVFASRHVSSSPQTTGVLWSRLGFVERVLPAARARAVADPLLVALEPHGAVWEKQKRADRYDVGSTISHEFEKVASKYGAELIELGEEPVPHGYAFPLAALLPGSAAASFERLVVELRAASYDVRGPEYGMWERLTEPGELELNAATLAILPRLDGHTAVLDTLSALRDCGGAGSQNRS